MKKMFSIVIILFPLGIGLSFLAAEEKPAELAGILPSQSVEKIAERALKSVVVISVTGRSGTREGLGTGFVVAADGLIATNMHVIGEARPVTVELADGKKFPVTSVHASDRSLDLALIRIDAKNLTPLPLGNSQSLKVGQPVVGLGNPVGLSRSVVAGVVSEKREIDGKSMIQLAIPIEPGNSGGPLLDLDGKVQGLLTMKSAVTANLGFAVPINSLKPLLEKPNPIPMVRWLTIGALDSREWKTLGGARWWQRAGHLHVEGVGTNFGGRSLCLSQKGLPSLPFELGVSVRMDDEAGAAGLVFHADGGDKHYGFYPTNGQLRLTLFEGPDVYSWKILDQKKSEHYHASEWNELRVRFEKEKFRCFVNDHLVFEAADTQAVGSHVGVAKFRETKGEFKNFRIGESLSRRSPPARQVEEIHKWAEELLRNKEESELVPPPGDLASNVTILRERAKLLEKHAQRLRTTALGLHHRQVQKELTAALTRKETDIDLIKVALLVAKLDNEELEVESYRQEMDQMIREVKELVPPKGNARTKIDGLNRYLFSERGFHGSRNDYYNRSNSYLNEVIDDQEGIPLTLSILYLEMLRGVGLGGEGIGLPGHFLVRVLPPGGEDIYVDVFEKGKVLTKRELIDQFPLSDGQTVEKFLVAATKRSMVLRILHNLMGVAQRQGEINRLLAYLDTFLVLSPESGDQRWIRAVLRFQKGIKRGAGEDIDWLLEHQPAGVNLERVMELQQMLDQGRN